MSKLISDYAKSIGVTESDGHTSRNTHLSVADCKHLRNVLKHTRIGSLNLGEQGERWNAELAEYLKGAC